MTDGGVIVGAVVVAAGAAVYRGEGMSPGGWSWSERGPPAAGLAWRSRRDGCAVPIARRSSLSLPGADSLLGSAVMMTDGGVVVGAVVVAAGAAVDRGEGISPERLVL